MSGTLFQGTTPQGGAAASAMIRDAHAAADRLTQWLLHGPVQMSSGEHAGGVVGTFNREGQASYVYGEITGYYLHWLSSPHLAASPRIKLNANAASLWVERQFNERGLPPTRIYLDGHRDADWYSQAQFCFDLAMLVGGLAAAARRGLIAPPLTTLNFLTQQLSLFADGQRLQPFQTANASALPKRWSTQSGPFLVKAAARILSARAFVPITPELLGACNGHALHLDAHVTWVDTDPLHPTLYYLEGMLDRHPDQTLDIAFVLDRLLAMSDAYGSLPESSAAPAVRRADIIAQALRVGVLLAAQGETKAPETKQLDRLAAQLIQRVAHDGSIAFRPDGAFRQCNVWCAMFAEQALSWYARWRAGETLGVNASDIV
jgi:hypothetical protein